MMKIKILLFLGFTIIGGALWAGIVVAQNQDDPEPSIQFPVAELGNCQDKASCKSYCDDADHADACLEFAKKNRLMSDGEISMARKMLKGELKGPGGCSNKSSCQQYCSNVSHMDECMAFAEANNFVPEEDRGQFEKAKKIQKAIKSGLKPPCESESSCQVFCQQNAENMKSCMEFGEKAGILDGQDLERARGFQKAIESGVKPLPCFGEACQQYCSQENHMQECMDFAQAAGFMSKEEAESVRKTGGKGPGGCMGRESCESFCSNPDNQQTCLEFSKEHGLMSAEDSRHIQGQQDGFKQAMQNAPSAVIDCIKEKTGTELVEKLHDGFLPSQEMGKSLQECFRQFGTGPEQSHGENGNGDNRSFENRPLQGPGGCSSQEECMRYCQENPDACSGLRNQGQGQSQQNFQEPFQQSPCDNPEDCQKQQRTIRPSEDLKSQDFDRQNGNLVNPKDRRMMPQENINSRMYEKSRSFGPQDGKLPTEGQGYQENFNRQPSSTMPSDMDNRGSRLPEMMPGPAMLPEQGPDTRGYGNFGPMQPPSGNQPMTADQFPSREGLPTPPPPPESAPQPPTTGHMMVNRLTASLVQAFVNFITLGR